MPKVAPVNHVVDALNAHRVKYVLIGGAALTLHGSAYVTHDVDIVYERSPENVARLVDALRPLQPQLRGDGVTGPLPIRWEPKTILNGANFTLTTNVGDIDLLGVISPDLRYADLDSLAAIYTVGHRTIPMLTLEGLLATKRAAGRPKDQLALPEIEAMLEVRRLEGLTPAASTTPQGAAEGE